MSEVQPYAFERRASHVCALVCPVGVRLDLIGGVTGERAVARTMTMELESQVVVLRLLAFAASLAAAVVVATNRQDRWGIVVTLKIDIRRLGVRTHVNQYGPVQSPRLLVNRWDLLAFLVSMHNIVLKPLVHCRGINELRLRRLRAAHGRLREEARQQALAPLHHMGPGALLFMHGGCHLINRSVFMAAI